MSTIKSSAENLTLNADGSNNDIIFQSNGSNVATLDQAGLLTATTFAGSGASLTALNATNLGSGTVPTARLGTGTANSSVHLRGDGTWAAAGGGKVLQVVQSDTTTSVNITTTTLAATGLSCSITPSATSSKILIITTQTLVQYTGAQDNCITHLHLERDSSSIATFTARARIQNHTGRMSDSANISYLDSPSTTSSITYRTTAQLDVSGQSRDVEFQYSSGRSTMILMEIEG